HAVVCRANGVEFRIAGLVRFYPLVRAAIERALGVLVGQMATRRAPNKTAHAGDQRGLLFAHVLCLSVVMFAGFSVCRVGPGIYRVVAAKLLFNNERFNNEQFVSE
ncbi:MAG: hypothetical protein WDZ49_12200, partial [Litorilinea sp.]